MTVIRARDLESLEAFDLSKRLNDDSRLAFRTSATQYDTIPCQIYESPHWMIRYSGEPLKWMVASDYKAGRLTYPTILFTNLSTAATAALHS